MDWAKTTAWGYKKHLSFGIWCDLYKGFYGTFNNLFFNVGNTLAKSISTVHNRPNDCLSYDANNTFSVKKKYAELLAAGWDVLWNT